MAISVETRRLVPTSALAPLIERWIIAHYEWHPPTPDSPGVHSQMGAIVSLASELSNDDPAGRAPETWVRALTRIRTGETKQIEFSVADLIVTVGLNDSSLWESALAEWAL